MPLRERRWPLLQRGPLLYGGFTIGALRIGLAMCATESVISRYMQFLKEHGYPTTGSAFLQTWTSLHHQIWLKRRMTTGEAQLFLKVFMASSGFSEEELTRIGCHSLKCTLLSWTSKDAIFQSQTDFLWATICPKENQSAVVYSRDELTRVAVVIYQMIRNVKTNTSNQMPPELNVLQTRLS